MTDDDDGNETDNYSDAYLPKYGICLGVDLFSKLSSTRFSVCHHKSFHSVFDGLIELPNGFIGFAVLHAYLDTLIGP